MTAARRAEPSYPNWTSIWGLRPDCDHCCWVATGEAGGRAFRIKRINRICPTHRLMEADTGPQRRRKKAA